MSFAGLGEEGDDGPCGLRSTPLSVNPLRLPKFEVIDPVHLSICRITAAGVTMVAAVGNDSMNADLILPAGYPEVIAVSAFTDTDGRPGGLGPDATCLPGEADDTFASFSNFGPIVDISAPSTCVLTTFAGNAYIVDNGTSLAAPHVGGAVALLRARHPSLTPIDVRKILEKRAEPGPIPGDPDNDPEGFLNVKGF